VSKKNAKENKNARKIIWDEIKTHPLKTFDHVVNLKN